MLGSLQVIDVMLTGTLLALFTQAAEGNPIARLLTDLGLPGLLVLLALKLGAVTLMWWTQSGVRLASAVYSLVAINNLLGLLVLVSL
jgi:hypothetical protein